MLPESEKKGFQQLDFCMCTHYKIGVVGQLLCALAWIICISYCATKDFTHFLWVSLDIWKHWVNCLPLPPTSRNLLAQALLLLLQSNGAILLTLWHLLINHCTHSYGLKKSVQKLWFCNCNSRIIIHWCIRSFSDWQYRNTTDILTVCFIFSFYFWNFIDFTAVLNYLKCLSNFCSKNNLKGVGISVYCIISIY